MYCDSCETQHTIKIFLLLKLKSQNLLQYYNASMYKVTSMKNMVC